MLPKLILHHAWIYFVSRSVEIIFLSLLSFPFVFVLAIAKRKYYNIINDLSDLLILMWELNTIGAGWCTKGNDHLVVSTSCSGRKRDYCTQGDVCNDFNEIKIVNIIYFAYPGKRDVFYHDWWSYPFLKFNVLVCTGFCFFLK